MNLVRRLQEIIGVVGRKKSTDPTRKKMQPWIIEELWRREEEEQRRRDEYERRQEIHIDAPEGPAQRPNNRPDPDEQPKRGVLIIEL